LVRRAETAFAASRALPPPKPITMSQPAARAWVAATVMRSSVGSEGTEKVVTATEADAS
jgi:hypothetical protein